jgi:hypothetical protein
LYLGGSTGFIIKFHTIYDLDPFHYIDQAYYLFRTVFHNNLISDNDTGWVL